MTMQTQHLAFLGGWELAAALVVLLLLGAVILGAIGFSRLFCRALAPKHMPAAPPVLDRGCTTVNGPDREAPLYGLLAIGLILFCSWSLWSTLVAKHPDMNLNPVIVAMAGVWMPVGVLTILFFGIHCLKRENRTFSKFFKVSFWVAFIYALPAGLRLVRRFSEVVSG